MTVKKGLLIAGAVLAFTVTACILVYQMLTRGRIEPLVLLLLAAVISIMLPMARTHFLPSAADCRAELDFHIRRQEAFIHQQVAAKLGPAAVQQIGAAPNAATESPADYLLTLLEKPAEPPDTDLRFSLLICLSGFYEKTGDPEAAVESLTQALRSRPQDFVTRFRLARNLEWQGRPSEALDVYRQILDTPAGLSRAMIKLTRRQMETLDRR